MKRSYLKRKTPIKSYTRLKSKKPMNKISAKQKLKNKELARINPPEDGLCENCHRPPDFRGLQKHHIVFRSKNGNDTRDNIKWLCGGCHNLMHGITECKYDKPNTETL